MSKPTNQELQMLELTDMIMGTNVISLQSIRRLNSPETIRNQYDYCACKIRNAARQLRLAREFMEQEAMKDPHLKSSIEMIFSALDDVFQYSRKEYDLAKEAC